MTSQSKKTKQNMHADHRHSTFNEYNVGSMWKKNSVTV